MASKHPLISTVFILGAGASAQGGTPLMADFLDIAEMLWRTGQVKDRTDDYKAVFEGRSRLQAIFAKANLDILNIEDVFAAFEMGKTLASLPGYDASQIQDLLHSTRMVIVKTIGITQKYGRSSEGKFTSPAPYGDFAKLVKRLQGVADPAHEITVITFNYDVGCEHGLFSEGLQYSYYLGDYESTPRCIPLLKLHGSLNWSRTPDGSLAPFRMEEFYQRYTPEPGPDQNHWILDIGSRLEGCEHFAGIDHPEPFLVPPTWNKTQHYSDVSKVWQKAAETLGKAENIIVSGFSLPPTDSFFKYLYALGTVGPGLLRRFWVFDISERGGVVDQRFRALLSQGVLPRYQYFQASFDQAMKTLKKEFQI